jgi:hypothetical protein
VGVQPGAALAGGRAPQAHGNAPIDGEPVPADDFERERRALPGRRSSGNGDGDLELMSRGNLALAILPGTRMTLPRRRRAGSPAPRPAASRAARSA